MMPSCDHTGVPIHFHSSTTSGSTCLMSLRILPRVSPRQSPSSAILFEMSSDADWPWLATGFFMLSSWKFHIYFIGKTMEDRHVRHHSHSIVLSNHNALPQQRKFFSAHDKATKNRLAALCDLRNADQAWQAPLRQLAISFSHGAKWKALISTYIGTIPV